VLLYPSTNTHQPTNQPPQPPQPQPAGHVQPRRQLPLLRGAPRAPHKLLGCPPHRRLPVPDHPRHRGDQPAGAVWY